MFLRTDGLCKFFRPLRLFGLFDYSLTFRRIFDRLATNTTTTSINAIELNHKAALVDEFVDKLVLNIEVRWEPDEP